jgi:hypothetical protein
MIFSFFWGKNSRCGLKKTLETRGLLRSSRKKGLCVRMNGVISFSLSLSLERARERGGTLVKTLASKRRKALLWSSVRRASSEALAVERGCKNNASKGQNEMREFLKTPTNNTESKKKKESKRKSKREYF